VALRLLIFQHKKNWCRGDGDGCGKLRRKEDPNTQVPEIETWGTPAFIVKGKKLLVQSMGVYQKSGGHPPTGKT
jgi:hypothetical protein